MHCKPNARHARLTGDLADANVLLGMVSSRFITTPSGQGVCTGPSLSCTCGQGPLQGHRCFEHGNNTQSRAHLTRWSGGVAIWLVNFHCTGMDGKRSTFPRHHGAQAKLLCVQDHCSAVSAARSHCSRDRNAPSFGTVHRATGV